MQRTLLPLLAVLSVLLTAAPASAAAVENPGPCTGPASLGMRDAEDHEHNETAQHQGLYCRIQQKAFLPLTGSELKGIENSKLGEMDVKADIAAVAIQEPTGGVLFFDVKDPANPKYLSTYLHATCGLGSNCGAYIDLTPDGKTAVLSVQQTDLMPGLINGTPGTTPGVALIDLTDPTKPTLSQEYQTVSVQGVHTTRTHQQDIGPAPGLYMYLIQNGVGVEVARIESTPTGPKAVRVANIAVPDADNIVSVHDTFIQTDTIDNKVYLYQAGGFTFGFRVYDVTNPAAPIHVATWDLTPQCVNDWYAHTIDVLVRDGKRIVTMPAEQFDFGAQSGPAECGTQSGNGDRPSTMWIVDATDLSKLGTPTESGDALKTKSETTLITTWNAPSGVPSGQLTFSAHNQQIVGDLIYLSHYHGGIFVLDASEAFALKKVRPKEIAWAVPCDAQVRPTLDSGTFPHSRCDFWDSVFYKDHILAADIKGGLYSLAIDGAGAGGGGAGGPGGGSQPGCTDTSAPISIIRRAKITRKGVDVRGRASDPGCEGRVTRVLVSIAQQKGKTCRYVTAKGRYRVGSRALDFAGNVEALRFRAVKVR